MYTMYLADKEIPILPENMKETVQMDNEKYDIVGLGERVKPGKEKLHTWSISSYFPRDFKITPKEYYEYFMGLIHRKYEKGDVTPIEPIKFILAREMKDGTIIFGINANVLIESIEWEDRKGEPGDLYYTFKLIEYKDFDKKKV